MDFIERLIGLSPDGGNGVSEMCLLLIPLGCLALLYFGRTYLVQRQRRR